MKWAEMTIEEKNTLIHEQVLHKQIELCTDGQLDPFMGSYWRCSCGWESDFHIGEGDTGHNIPVPNYVGSMDALMPCFEVFPDIAIEKHHNESTNITIYEVGIFPDPKPIPPWDEHGKIKPRRQIYAVSRSLTEALCDGFLQAVGAIDQKGNILEVE